MRWPPPCATTSAMATAGCRRRWSASSATTASCRRLTSDLFDENRRESALFRLNELMGKYFDGDGSRLAQLLDPTRQGSPLHQFRGEVTDEFRRLSERITAIEAGAKARAEERARGTAKGADFEDALEERLAELSRGASDLLERTGTDAGDALRSKKGDFVVGIDPTRTRGVDLRIAIEAKDRTVSLRRFAGELADARDNRRAAVALAVFSPLAAPPGVAPLTVIGTDVYCVYDPETDDAIALEAAYRLARALALATLRDAAVSINVPAVQAALDEVGRAVGEVQGMKVKLTSISGAAEAVSQSLDRMRMTRHALGEGRRGAAGGGGAEQGHHAHRLTVPLPIGPAPPAASRTLRLHGANRPDDRPARGADPRARRRRDCARRARPVRPDRHAQPPGR